MSFYLSRVAPTFKDWQFQNISEGISLDDWSKVVETIDTLNQLEDKERYNLVSVQNPEFYIHLWHTKKYGGAILFSNFPERYKGELIKYLFQICQLLGANVYSLDNDGHTANKFDFSLHTDKINKAYFPKTEKKVTTIEVSEMMGLMCIPNTDVSSVSSFLELSEDEHMTWEEAVQKCYAPNYYMVRNLQGWVIVIGQLENLIQKFRNKLNQEKSEKEQFIDLLILISAKFEKVSYKFNASKYSYFEWFITKNGKLTYKYIHGDGEEEVEGDRKEAYFEDFMAFCYDESILEGIQLYK